MFVIVGGAGLVGSAVARALAEDGSARVVVCDALGSVASGKWANLPERMDDLWAPGDLAANLDKAWRDIACVVSMADAGHAEADADALYDTAWRLPRRLWDFAVARQRPIAWASTTQVHGPTLGAFAAAKAAFDRHAARRGDGPDAPPVALGLRLAAIYGRGEAHKGALASLPARALALARAGAPVPLWRSTDPAILDGGHARDWTHADDAGAAIAALVGNATAGFHDIGTGALSTATDVVRAASRVAKAQARVIHVAPPPGADAGPCPAADLSSLRAAGVTTVFRDLDAGLAAL
jgi:ADP-L-glycero-D-manno-heptose 6-epimerase